MQHQFRLSQYVPLILLLLLLSACGEAVQVKTSSITLTPATTFTREQAIQRAREFAPQSMPEVGMQQARVDSVTAELITLADADRRSGGERGPGGYAPGQTAQSPVWWVTVKGYFKYEGMAAAGVAEHPMHETDERDFIYDARTGDEVGARIAPDRAPAVPAHPTPSPVIPITIAGLTIEENPIVARGVYTPDRGEYNRLIPRTVLDKHMRERNLPPDQRVAATNKVLAKYGYRLQHDPPRSSYVYLLYRDNQLLLDEITGFRPVTENTAGEDFLLFAYSPQHGDQVVRKNGIQAWHAGNVWASAPILYGNDVLEAQWEDKGWPFGGQVIVRQGQKEIYSIPAESKVENPIKGLWGWNGHWVLEVDGKLIIDGVNENQRLGYDEIFEWHLIHVQPFYFFKKGNAIGVSYAGQTLPTRYDRVIHYACCEPAMFNPGYTEDMLWFHALRGDVWYYVEAGVY